MDGRGTLAQLFAQARERGGQLLRSVEADAAVADELRVPPAP